MTCVAFGWFSLDKLVEDPIQVPQMNSEAIRENMTNIISRTSSRARKLCGPLSPWRPSSSKALTRTWKASSRLSQMTAWAHQTTNGCQCHGEKGLITRDGQPLIVRYSKGTVCSPIFYNAKISLTGFLIFWTGLMFRARLPKHVSQSFGNNRLFVTPFGRMSTLTVLLSGIL